MIKIERVLLVDSKGHSLQRELKCFTAAWWLYVYSSFYMSLANLHSTRVPTLTARWLLERVFNSGFAPEFFTLSVTFTRNFQAPKCHGMFSPRPSEQEAGVVKEMGRERAWRKERIPKHLSHTPVRKYANTQTHMCFYRCWAGILWNETLQTPRGPEWLIQHGDLHAWLRLMRSCVFLQVSDLAAIHRAVSVASSDPMGPMPESQGSC